METQQKPNVLFLEDDADTRELVKFTLEQAGINVISAETVAEAWHAALSHEVDLFLLDGLIPQGDSLKLCRDLRTIEPDKPIVFYSGLAYKADIKKGIDAGATGYLVKPYSGDLAEEILRYIFKSSQVNSTAPLFLDKENVLETFVGDSVRIMEFGGALDRGTTPPERRIRQRQFRATRTSRGII